MEKTSQGDCSCANEAGISPSFLRVGLGVGAARRWMIPLIFSLRFVSLCFPLGRCDEHLKNQKGFLGLTPLTPVTGWRLQYEQNDEKGLQLYFTPLKGTTDSHNLPIGVRWNPQTKRYQSLDRAYEHFLLESPSIQDARSVLR